MKKTRGKEGEDHAHRLHGGADQLPGRWRPVNVIIHDIPRIYTGIAEWAACMMFVLLFPPWIRRQFQIPAALGFLIFQCLFLEVTDIVSIFW